MIEVKEFFDPASSTFAYVVYDEISLEGVIIDSFLKFNELKGEVSTESLSDIVKFVSEKKISLIYSLETHVHADHISGAYELKSIFPTMKICIHENINDVFESFKRKYSLEKRSLGFDLYLKEEDILEIGQYKLRVIHTPGHTPACCCYHIENKLFTGDALFMPDFGSGRCDFPGGSAKGLFDSIRNKIFTLSKETEVYVGHDYRPNGRNLLFKTTIGESILFNKHLNKNVTEQDFISMREARDKELSLPKLLDQSIPVNLYAGKVKIVKPCSEKEGV